MGPVSARACAASNLLSLLLGLWICQHRPEVTLILGPASAVAIHEAPGGEPQPALDGSEGSSIQEREPEPWAPDSSAPAPAPAPAPPAPPVSVSRASQPPAQKRGVTRRCLDNNCTQVRARCRKNIYNPWDYRCPSDDWLRSMVQVDPDPDKILVNIGCNKGNDAIAWLELFDQQRRFSLRKWSKAVPRGPCELDPDISAPPPVTSAKSPVAVCVEAAPRNYKLLREKQKKFKYDADALRVVHAAASDSAKPGDTISFPDAPPGEERAGLSHNEHWKLVKVPLETVDTLVQRLRLPRVDAMLVDTEGADPAILAGAKQTLRMVRYLLFEVHRDIKGSHWSRQTLLSVVEMLDTLGFDCYWAGKSGSVASVTQCYEARFETIKWSNVACVKRGDVWWKVLEQRDPNATP